MPRLESQAKAGYYPTPDRVTETIASMLYKQYERHEHHRLTRVLDPCCGTGAALEELGESLAANSRVQVKTFGIELNAGRAKEASQRLDRTLSADLFSTSIANEAFSLLFLNPPYDDEIRSGDDAKKRTELAFLQKCTTYLKPGEGVLIFVVPQKILRGAARYLAANYEQLECMDFPSPERERFNQVFLMGVRKTVQLADPKEEGKIKAWSQGEIPKHYPQPKYAVPSTADGDILFTSLFFDPQNIAEEAAVSGLWANRALRKTLNPPEEERKRPLMPLRQGHVATLIAAGFLDNMELEDEDETKILVKGRSYKEPVLVESTAEKEVHREVLKHEITTLNLRTGEFAEIRA